MTIDLIFFVVEFGQLVRTERTFPIVMRLRISREYNKCPAAALCYLSKYRQSNSLACYKWSLLNMYVKHKVVCLWRSHVGSFLHLMHLNIYQNLSSPSIED